MVITEISPHRTAVDASATPYWLQDISYAKISIPGRLEFPHSPMSSPVRSLDFR